MLNNEIIRTCGTIFTDSEMLNQLSSRLEAAERELANARLDEKLQNINAARISQVSADILVMSSQFCKL